MNLNGRTFICMGYQIVGNPVPCYNHGVCSVVGRPHRGVGWTAVVVCGGDHDVRRRPASHMAPTALFQASTPVPPTSHFNF